MYIFITVRSSCIYDGLIHTLAQQQQPPFSDLLCHTSHSGSLLQYQCNSGPWNITIPPKLTAAYNCPTDATFSTDLQKLSTSFFTSPISNILCLGISSVPTRSTSLFLFSTIMWCFGVCWSRLFVKS